MPPPGHEPFLAMVLEDPADDGPRLVFADWLEEQGDPRGEFIRAQIEMSHLPTEDPRWSRLNDRQSELYTKHYDIWLTEVPIWSRNGCEYRRGFVTDVKVWTRWERHFGPELSACAPVERISLMKVADAMQEFAQHHGVRHLHELAILDDRMSPLDLRHLCRSEGALAPLRSLLFMGMNLLDSGALMLSLCPHLTGLQRLDLIRCQIQHRGVIVLTDGGRTQLKGLTWLNLSDNELGNDSLYALASSPMFSQIETLQWNDNELTTSAPRLLADAEPARLKHLELAGNRIGDIGARALLDCFPHLEYLDLARNPLTRGMQIMLKEHYGHRVRVPGV